MLVSLNWLREYVDLQNLSTEELAERITKSGIEVDGIHYVGEASTNVVVGHVLSCEQHPDADKLNLCQVDVGDETLQIICGAENIAQGQKVAVAKPGAVLPGNFKIKKAKLRGIESFGMICSLQELGLDETYIPKAYEDGIFVFPEDTKVGEPVEDLLNLNDVVLEFDLTPNRADCLSMIGVAYEVAAILDEEIKLPIIDVKPIAEETSDRISVQVEAEELNPYYAAFIVRDVQVAEGPLWMRNYLIASGIRPINNVVDITNYCLLEYGQPLHAFDYDLFDSKEIVVRRANEDEKLTTLDNVERTLNSEQLVITNGKEAVALAGVMGGASTEVHTGTTNILLEAAFFDGGMVRTTVKQTGLRSESSNRFEKGVDPNRVYKAGLRAAQLLVQYAGGKLLQNPVIYNKLDLEETVIPVNVTSVNHRLGTEISQEDIGKIFTKLRFSYTETEGVLDVSIPSRRGDLIIFEDMLEEIARIYGYDHLPYTLPSSKVRGGLTDKQQLKRNIKRFLEGTGLREAITYSLTEKERIDELISNEVRDFNPKPVKLSLPMTEEHEYLRIGLLPELVKVATYNQARNERNLRLYEIGSIFLSDEDTLTKQPREWARLAGLITGDWLTHPWQGEEKVVDFFVLKGIVESLFVHLQLECEFIKADVSDMHPGRTAEVLLEGNVVGFIGQLHPTYAKVHDLSETFVFDLDYEAISNAYERKTAFMKIPRFPTITRDIAFVVDEATEADQIKAKIIEVGGEWLQDVHVFDVYAGEHLEAGKKSVAYHLLYQHPEKTLQDEDVASSYDLVIETIQTAFAAEARTS